MANPELPRRAVYAITCTDGRAYVGGTINLKARWREHRGKLRRGAHHNGALQDAWAALGERAFEFTVIEVDPPGNLSEAEQRHMDRLRPHLFNHAPFAGTQRGIVHTPETRAKVSAANLARYRDPAERAKLSRAQVERFSDPDQRTLISAAGVTRFARPGERAKHSEALKGVSAGERNAQAKLTDGDVREVRRLAASGTPHSVIGERFGMTQPNISRIVSRKGWAHVP